MILKQKGVQSLDHAVILTEGTAAVIHVTQFAYLLSCYLIL